MKNRELDEFKGTLMVVLLTVCFYVLVVGVVTYLW